MHHWFRDWFNSPYYHSLYAHRDNKEAADFIDKLISHLQPFKGACMLDVACGKGRHALQLASKGFDVTGIDLSEKSISEALKQEKENLHFYVHDMRLPCWINYFDYAFNFFTSFGYFETLREHQDALRSIAGALRDGGIFVMDYLNVLYAEKHLKLNSREERDNYIFEIKRYSDEHHFIKEITVEDRNMNDTYTFFEKVAKFSLGDLQWMLAASDLQVKEIFGDYSLGNYDEKESPRLLLIAEKKRRLH
jgi:SAM-dependent methyltransferase